MAENIKTAKIVKKSEMVGKGCVIQGLGLLAPFVGALIGPVGIAIGVIILVIFFFMGSQQSQKWTCGNCGTALLDKKIHECPGCHAQFK